MYVDHGRRWRIFDGVLHDISQPTLQHHAICTYQQTAVALYLDLLSLLLGEEAKKANHFAGKVQRAEGCSVERDFAGISPGYRKEAVDHLSESRHFFQHASDGISIFFRCVQALEPHLSDATDRCQRRSQLVGCIRGKAL